MTVKVKNFTDLKRKLGAGIPFEIVDHGIKPQYNGQRRVVQKMQTNGMYTGIYGDPDDELSKCNYGKGSWIAFENAHCFEFLADGTIRQYTEKYCHTDAEKRDGRYIWTIRLFEQED